MALAILSAMVFTGDPARPRAEALGIENGKIVAVGSNDEVMATLRGKVEEFRLPGRLVTPGLVDGHCHFLSYGLYLQRVDLRDLPSLAACRERSGRRCGAVSPASGSWDGGGTTTIGTSSGSPVGRIWTISRRQTR